MSHDAEAHNRLVRRVSDLPLADTRSLLTD
jgi:hypothetical protein